ncbi:MAG: bifunctional oligoribonuclease/PAP phosphatase NrnA [Anaerolineaceae bacterium]|nr:bifunctional oligoribonuclease/PAP phosphatase NrnA [Anaerolineaceae bacterium]
MKNDQLHDSIRQKISNAKNIVIVSHIRPDGDAVGSVLGLGLALQATGKNVQMVLADGVPSSFHHLKGYHQIARKPKGEYDLLIVVDCSDLLRVGTVIKDRTPDINIDHHITNQNFAIINYVDASAPATTAILAANLSIWGLPITQPIAAALLSGLISDTLGFRTTNVTPDSLRLAADLMEHGANLSELYMQALINRSFESARYWGYGLEKLQRKDGIVWTSLALEDRSKATYPGNDDADLVNTLSTIEDADIALIFVEQREGKVKISWRARPGLDVSQIALAFGGGGHPAAAGAEVTGTLEEVQERVLLSTQAALKTSTSQATYENLSVK